MTIDFIEEKGKIDKIEKALDKLISNKLNEITVVNIPSQTFTELFDVDEVTDFNGWQCDWWSTMHYKGKSLNLFGCAWDASVVISADDELHYEDEDSNDEDENYDNDELLETKNLTKEKEVDVYHDTTVMIRGRERHKILPVDDNVSISEAENLVKEGKLKKYYVWRTTTDSYTLIYSPNEKSARQRILAIWGDFNDISDEDSYQEKCEFYKKHIIGSNRVKFSGEYYVLDLSYIVNLSKEETLEFLKEIEDIKHDEGKLRSDEIKETVENWEKEHGYFGKIVNFDEETIREHFS